MICRVYRSSRKPDTYLYLPEDSDFQLLPEQLRRSFGQPEKVMALDITVSSKLARVKAKNVLSGINDQGYYLQLPPNLYEIKHDPWA